MSTLIRRVFFENGKKALPLNVTSYDLFKTLAVVTMIIDHVGYYFFPDDMWWRTVGRLSFPIWFFLIGYARSRDISPRIIGGALVLIAGNILAGMALLPFNILVSIALVRACLDPLMKRLLVSKTIFWGGVAVLFIFIIPTYFITEYGTQGIIAAMFGWLARNRDRQAEKDLLFPFAIFFWFSYIMSEFIVFGLSQAQGRVLMAGCAAVWFILYNFKPAEFPALGRPRILAAFLQLCGRRTLEIYVVHLLLFKAMALYLGMEGFGFLGWSWTGM